MKLFFRVIHLLLLAILLTSCGNNEKFDSAPDHSMSEPSLKSFGYKLTDDGDGWKLGILHLVFENSKDYEVPVGKPSWGYSVSDAYVETNEGKTYPIRVYADYSEFAKAEGNAQSNDNYIALNMPKMPPGLRVYKWETEHGDAGGNYILEFKVANAATPTAIIFPGKPEWNIVLEQVPDMLPMPLTASSASVKSIASLKGKVLMDQEGKLLVTLGDCKSGYIDVISQNRDSFFAASDIITFPAVAFIKDGEMSYIDNQRLNPSVGPAQTIKEEVWIYSRDADYVIFYWNGDTYDIVSTDVCK